MLNACLLFVGFMAFIAGLSSRPVTGPAIAASPPLDVRIAPSALRQGDVALVSVGGASGAREVTGRLGERALHFFPRGDGHMAIVGIDLETAPGRTPWRIEIVDGAGASRAATGELAVRARQFPVQRLTLPRQQVDLDPETLRRAEAEAARLAALYDTLTPERLWRGPFARPVGGESEGHGFGARRIINGQPRRPHSGLDYTASRGTPVLAANRGRVALAGDFFFPGHLVVLDHGLGLYTLYMHLDRVDAVEGALVDRGETLGTVGATGRATGPHLHFAAQVGRARVDPQSLLGASLRD
ncbi:MAG: M23 family metallopeptidase [Candidatus Rokuibacteriota bacterium]